MMNTTAAAAISTRRMVRAGDAICSWSVLTSSWIRACGEYASGCSRSIDACTPASSARAASTRGARGQPAEQVGHAVLAVGVHRRAEMVRARHHVRDDLRSRSDRAPTARGRRPRSPAVEPRRIVWPITAGSLLSTSFQKRCVSTAAPAAPGPSSAGVNSRPSTGRSPITSKNDPLTTPALTRRGSLAEPDQRELDGGKIAERGDRRGARLEVSRFRGPRR